MNWLTSNLVPILLCSAFAVPTFIYVLFDDIVHLAMKIEGNLIGPLMNYQAQHSPRNPPEGLYADKKGATGWEPVVEKKTTPKPRENSEEKIDTIFSMLWMGFFSGFVILLLITVSIFYRQEVLDTLKWMLANWSPVYG